MIRTDHLLTSVDCCRPPFRRSPTCRVRRDNLSLANGPFLRRAMNATTTRPQRSVIQSAGSGTSVMENRNPASVCQPEVPDWDLERSSGSTTPDTSSMASFRVETAPSRDPVVLAFASSDCADVDSATFEMLARVIPATCTDVAGDSRPIVGPSWQVDDVRKRISGRTTSCEIGGVIRGCWTVRILDLRHYFSGLHRLPKRPSPSRLPAAFRANSCLFPPATKSELLGKVAFVLCLPIAVEGRSVCQPRARLIQGRKYEPCSHAKADRLQRGTARAGPGCSDRTSGVFSGFGQTLGDSRIAGVNRRVTTATAVAD